MICALQEVVVSENFLMVYFDSNIEYCQEWLFFLLKKSYFEEKMHLRVMFAFFFLSQGKWDVPLPKVKAVGEDEVFKVIKTGRSKSKSLGVQFCPHSLCYRDCDYMCELASLR